MKTQKLFDLEEIVNSIITKYPECKKCDMLLYYRYCEKIMIMQKGSFKEEDFIKIFSDKKFRMKNRISCYASIERVRRKIQARDLESLDLQTVEIRKGEKSAYVQYALTL